MCICVDLCVLSCVVCEHVCGYHFTGCMATWFTELSEINVPHMTFLIEKINDMRSGPKNNYHKNLSARKKH